MIKDQKETVGLGKPGPKKIGSKTEPNSRAELKDAGIDKKLSSHARRRSRRRHCIAFAEGKIALPPVTGHPGTVRFAPSFVVEKDNQDLSARAERYTAATLAKFLG